MVARRLKTPRNCEHCGSSFRPRSRTSRFCSRRCIGLGCHPRSDLGTKTCDHCGRRFGRRTDGARLEKPFEFARRRYCDKECAALARSRHLGVVGEKRCEHCNDPIGRRKRIRPSVIAKMRFCGRACASADRLIAVPAVKRCVECGEEFSRRPDEKRGGWRLRRLCTQACAGRRGRRNDAKMPKPLAKAMRNMRSLAWYRDVYKPRLAARRLAALIAAAADPPACAPPRPATPTPPGSSA